MNSFIEKIFAHNGNLDCLIYEDKIYSYNDLKKAFDEKITLLESIPKGSSLAIVGGYDLESIALLLACIESKMIIAPLIKGETNIESKLSEAQIEYILLDSKPTKTNYIKNNKLFENLKGTSGLILFSSGSTGKPKAIIHNFDLMLEGYLDKKPKHIKMLLFLGFDHIGGINTLLNCLAIGGCGIAIENRKDIELIAKAIEKHKISLLPSSPSLLNLMLIAQIHTMYDLSSLKIITYGAEQMPHSLLERLKLAYPKTRFHQTFGTSETGISQTKTLNNAIKLENIDYKIINGELFLKSKTQTLGYLNADNSVFNDGYFATGDLVKVVEKNGEEFIEIIGRKKEMINIGGEKLLPQEVESVILELPFILECLVYGESNPITGQSVSAKIKLNPKCKESKLSNVDLKKIIREFCKDKMPRYKIPSKILKVDEIALSDRMKKSRN
ncbi:AMP-dependent synthetase [Helicobacter sp. 16-1353]|uniref:ANL family adenylate-forming protein n=1 Tax=Helicobacter sp. 16-1353 TaxID=2004996 RepID=UPI000DCC8A14|nr:fatty acid--CoA ligase family protein [Helicobacter sp. 16-1353]RAX51426.1 AMP-dependent synthetase [Helicobacter sp. 16-1353]